MYNWFVSFDDGDRISFRRLLEDNPQMNPWHTIVDHVKKSKSNIQHIELVVNNVHYNTPSIGKKAAFRSYQPLDKPWVFYKETAEFSSNSQRHTHFVGISYRLGDYRLINWVNTYNNASYTQVLNVIDPQNEAETRFAGIESEIESAYST